MRYTTYRYASFPRKDWGGTLTGASSGFKLGSSIGSVFGPIGSGIAGGIGAVVGGIFGNSAENKAKRKLAAQEREMNLAKAKAKAEEARIAKETIYNSDKTYLNTLQLNNANSLFMKKGGQLKYIGSRSSYSPYVNKRNYGNQSLARNLEFMLKDYAAEAKRFDDIVNNKTKNNLGYTKEEAEEKRDLALMISNLYKEQLNKKPKLNGEPVDIDALSYEDSPYKSKGGWIQDATANIKRRGTEGVCTGSKFGSSSCPPGSKRYILAKTFKKIAKNRADGGRIAANGKELGEGDKLLTKNGTTIGSHETGQNIPLRKNGKVVAIAEPGEVLVNDKSMPLTPFILSKRIGRYGTNGISFAEEYTNLENNKDKSNSKMITKRQKNLIRLNNIVSDNTKFAANGTQISKDNPYSLPTVDIVGNKTSFMKTLSPGTVSNNLGIQKYTGTLPTDHGKKFGKIGSTAKNIFGKLGSSDNVNTLISAAGTIGNILMTNKTLNKQRDYINANLKEALAYNPSYNKNYLLDETVDVSNNVSSINQGYLHSTAGLNNIDPAIASALKNNANLSRTSALQSVYGEAGRTRIGLRNQNITNIANVNRGNTDLRNQTSLMKLNAKIASNEQLADLEGTRLANFQGAISELNSVMSDRAALKSMDARWKDTIGKDYQGVSKCGGRIGRRKRKLVR